jgi:hypothetical protein
MMLSVEIKPAFAGPAGNNVIENARVTAAIVALPGL